MAFDSSSVSVVIVISGKVTGVEAAKEKFETQIDYKLVSVSNGQTTAQNKVAQKIEGTAEVAAQTALSQAARAVLTAAAAGGKN